MALILNSSASSFATRKSFLFSSAPSSPFKSKSQKSNHQIKPNPRIFFESKFLGAPKNQRVHRISSTVAPPPLLKKQLRKPNRRCYSCREHYSCSLKYCYSQSALLFQVSYLKNGLTSLLSIYARLLLSVFLFMAGTVVYGVLIYLQNEKFNRNN